MSAPTNGTYYITNDATKTSFYFDGTNLKATTRTSADSKYRFEVTRTGSGSTATIKALHGAQYVAVSDTKPGSSVKCSDSMYIWKIASIGFIRYSITCDNAADGPMAVQVVSSHDDVGIYVGPHVGANSQQWIFERVRS